MTPIKPFNPARRARQIRDAIVKRNNIIEDTLEILDQIGAEQKTA